MREGPKLTSINIKLLMIELQRIIIIKLASWEAMERYLTEEENLDNSHLTQKNLHSLLNIAE